MKNKHIGSDFNDFLKESSVEDIKSENLSQHETYNKLYILSLSYLTSGGAKEVTLDMSRRANNFAIKNTWRYFNNKNLIFNDIKLLQTLEIKFKEK